MKNSCEYRYAFPVSRLAQFRTEKKKLAQVRQQYTGVVNQSSRLSQQVRELEKIIGVIVLLYHVPKVDLRAFLSTYSGFDLHIPREQIELANEAAHRVTISPDYMRNGKTVRITSPNDTDRMRQAQLQHMRQSFIDDSGEPFDPLSLMPPKFP